MRKYFIFTFMLIAGLTVANAQNFSKFDVVDNNGIKGLNGLAHRTGAKIIDILVPEEFNLTALTVDYEIAGSGQLAEPMPTDFSSPQIVKTQQDASSPTTDWTVTVRKVKSAPLPLFLDFADSNYTPADWNETSAGWAWAAIDTGQKKVVRFGNLTATLIVAFNSSAESITYSMGTVGGNDFSTGLFHVYASADGEHWTVLRTFDQANPLIGVRDNYTENLDADVRFVKWVYTQRVVNVNIYGISVLPKEIEVEPEPEDPYKADFNLPREYEGMELVWNDEFNYNGKPNPANWRYETGFVRNEELQWYQSDNIICEDGLLVIEARREEIPNPNYEEGSSDWKKNRQHAAYTSSSISTQKLQEFKYGRFEIRARIDTTLGSWPAIWGKGTSGSWPYCGEVDIMEFYRKSKDPKRPILLSNYAWGHTNPNSSVWNTGSFPLENFTAIDENWCEKFHVWRLDWTADSMKIYLDDQLLNAQDLSKATNPSGSNPAEPFQQDFYFLLNLAVGSNGGNPASSPFPIRYEVDYFRVYQKVETGTKNSHDQTTQFGPNPVKDILNIHSQHSIESLLMFDAMGKVIAQYAYPESQIDMQSFAAGIYILYFKNTDGNVGYRKIIKSN